MDEYKKLREEYLKLRTYEEYQTFRKKHKDFFEMPFDLEMKLKVNEIFAAPGATYEPTMIHEEVLDKSKPNPFGVKLD